MVIRKEHISNWYYFGILLVLAVATYLAMPDLDNQTDVGTGMSFLAVVGLAVLQIPLLIYIFSERLKNNIHPPRFLVYYGIYFCWMVAITLSHDTVHNIFGITTLVLSIFVFPIMLYCSYYRAKSSDLDKWFYAAVIFIMLLIILQYRNLFSIASMVNEGRSHFAISYFPLFILPILLLSPSRIIRYLSIAVTSIIIISSIKRSGLITLSLTLLTYVYFKQKISGEKKIRQLITFGIILLLMTGVGYYLSQSEDNNIIERITNIKDDGGSGRDVIWEDAFHNIINQDWGSRMIGNGYRSAQTVSKYHIASHNDVLEIWYDFGGIGLLLYSIAFFSLCAYTYRLFKRKSQYTPHMVMTLTYFVMFSLTSIVILYYWMVLFMFSIGIIAGLADKELVTNEDPSSALSR